MLNCAVPRLEAGLADGPPALPCPRRDVCPSANPTCLVFAPGWWCDDRQLCVFPELVRDCDDEPDDYG
jgi:hypothetical protein